MSLKDHYVTLTRTSFMVEKGTRKTATTERVPAKTRTVKSGVLVKIEDEDTVAELKALKAIRDPIVGEILRTSDGEAVEVKARSASTTTEAAKVAQAGADTQRAGSAGAAANSAPVDEKEVLLTRAKELGVRGASKNWPADTLRNKINEREAEIAAENREQSNGGPGANDEANKAADDAEKGESEGEKSDDDTGGMV